MPEVLERKALGKDKGVDATARSNRLEHGKFRLDAKLVYEGPDWSKVR